MTNLDRAGRKLRSARNSLKEAMTGAEVTARQAASEGVSEVQIAKSLGVDRMTVRRWLGKL
jgi:DNA-binding GntR family transcriptional regulator